MSFYVSSLHLDGKQWGTCKQYSNSILRTLRKAGFKIDNSSWSIFQAARKGFKKTRPPKKDKRLPITPLVLEALRPGLDLEVHDDRVMWALLCAMVYGLFRCAELTAADDASATSFPRERDFRRVHGEEEKAAHIHLDQSKTDILSQGVDVPLVANSSPTCPIKAISQMQQQTPHQPYPESPLFRLTDGTPMTSKQFRKRTKQLVAKAKLADAAKYTAHSCRRGGAQALFDAGVPVTEIKIIGRWKSDSFLHYIGVTLAQMMRSSALMATAKQSISMAFA